MAYSCAGCGCITEMPRCVACGGRPGTAQPHSKQRARGKLRLAVIQRDQGICQLCGYPVQHGTEHIDHKVPRIHGGTTTLGNLQLTHRACNQRKGTG